MQARTFVIAALALPAILTSFGNTGLTAQWLNYPAPGIPRLRDGRPDLSAPAPRTPDGRPDLDGIWYRNQEPLDEFGLQTAAAGQKIDRAEIAFTPYGQQLLQRRPEDDFPGARCLPLSLPGLSAAQPLKILSSKNVVVILYEVLTLYRQIFMDGRPHPTEPNPAWMGYSVGRWEGDTLVVDTTGFNDRWSILPGRRPHSDALRIVQRFRRRDFGHLSIEFTIHDPKVYAKPWTIREELHLTPDTELLEYICNENERDLKHMVGSEK